MGHTSQLTNEARFWRKVDISNPGGCWEWIKSFGAGGYGKFWTGDKLVGAHVYAYTLVNGEIPNGMVIRHRCNNPKCVRPAHLLIGTHKENSQDAVLAGSYARKGILGRDRAAQIAKRLVQGEVLLKLARDFDVSYRAIWQIKNGISYRAEMQEAIAELNTQPENDKSTGSPDQKLASAS